MFGKHYYTLVAGLREFSRDTDVRGFDAPAIIAEIREGVGRRDRATVELFYSWYDIENFVNIRAGREHFSVLGNLTREQLEQLASGTGSTQDSPQDMSQQDAQAVPAWFSDVVGAYIASEKDGAAMDVAEGLDMTRRLESNLFAVYYARCAKSSSKFLREWSRFDLALRNIAAAFAARRLGVPVGGAVVGDDEIVSALVRSSAADFGLKGEVGYIDRIMAATCEGPNIMEKERRLDDIRWDMAEELTSLDYFDIDFLLGYLARVNIVHRWATLDPQQGEEMLRKLLGNLTGSHIIEKNPLENYEL